MFFKCDAKTTHFFRLSPRTSKTPPLQENKDKSDNETNYTI